MQKVTKLWNSYDHLFSKNNALHQHAIIILNTPIKLKPGVLLNLWNNASVRITVDGGTNQWWSWLQKNESKCGKAEAPHLITGDFDSITPETMKAFMKHKTVQIVKTPDQDETDFTKALKELNKYCLSNNLEVDNVFVIVDTNGRFDHIMANINTLFKASSLFPNDVKLYLFSSNSMTWLLEGGAHKISIPLPLRDKQSWCGLIPLGKPAIVSTRGLKWNLTEDKMEFGGMVSTSNTYDGSPEVGIETNAPIIWTMGTDELI